jgi:hypothetical protein
MCTVSFRPTAAGFRLAMNRDEKRTRVAALPPEIFSVHGRRAIYPREPDGGTWLAVNDAGLCLALVNWHRIKREPEGRLESRGRIIPQLIGASDGRVVGRELGRMALRQVRPFRLISIDAGREIVTEWQWNTIALAARSHRWQIAHWFSSGYDEVEAERQREKVCATSSLGGASSFKRLHASHLPKRGPFSICMHRTDATTVSFSEVIANRNRITLRYQPGPPCEDGDQVARWLGCSRDR